MKNVLVKTNVQLATLWKLISIFLPSSVSRIPRISLPFTHRSINNFVRKEQISS